jgi:hypothetical protein
MPLINPLVSYNDRFKDNNKSMYSKSYLESPVNLYNVYNKVLKAWNNVKEIGKTLKKIIKESNFKYRKDFK